MFAPSLSAVAAKQPTTQPGRAGRINESYHPTRVRGGTPSWGPGFLLGGHADVPCVLWLPLFVGNIFSDALVFFSYPVHDRHEDSPGKFCTSRLARN